jgi:hypothetical protein
MILEAALQHNQSRLSQHSVDSDTAPASPISPSSPNADGLAGQKDVVFVPINITYEKIPELAMLVDEVLDQRPQSQAASLRLPMQGVTRPSEAMDKRQKTLEGNQATKGRYGRALVGFGDVISVQNMAAEVNSTLKLPVFGALAEDEAMVQKITKKIQQNQRDALIISPVGLVSAIVLYGRATGGVHLGECLLAYFIIFLRWTWHCNLLIVFSTHYRQNKRLIRMAMHRGQAAWIEIGLAR